jgi:hypothetical protein
MVIETWSLNPVPVLIDEFGINEIAVREEKG